MAFLESYADLASLIDYLRLHTPLRILGNVDAHSVFKTLNQLGYRIKTPDAHPSGLRTTEAPTTEVVPIGSGMARSFIDKRATRR